MMAIEAAIKSTYNERAQTYKRREKLPLDMTTAVNVQMMVFGNLNTESGAGVVFTRDPGVGENVFFGEYLPASQGDELAQGIETASPVNIETKIRTGKNVSTMEEEMPGVYEKLTAIGKALESHFKDVMEIEFTVQDESLHILQAMIYRNVGKESDFNIILGLCEDGVITKEAAKDRISSIQIDKNALSMLAFDEPNKKTAEEEGRLLTKGLAASPGAAVGKVVLNTYKAEEMGKTGGKVILVRPETSPADLSGMLASQGILTSHGGTTSHAALNARHFYIPAVVGAGEIMIAEDNASFSIGDTVVREGDYLSIDGDMGRVYLGEIKTHNISLSEEDVRAYYLSKLGELSSNRQPIEERDINRGPADAKSKKDRGRRLSPSGAAAEVASMESLAGQAGPDIAVGCQLFIPQTLLSQKDCTAINNKYDNRFEAIAFNGTDIAESIIGKVRDKDRAIALITKEMVDKNPDILEKLKAARVRFLITRNKDINELNALGKAKEPYLIDTFNILLYALSIPADAAENSPLYRLLKYYLQKQFDLDGIAVDDYINAIAAMVIAKLVKGYLAPIKAFRGEELLERHHSIAQTSIAA